MFCLDVVSYHLGFLGIQPKANLGALLLHSAQELLSLLHVVGDKADVVRIVQVCKNYCRVSSGPPWSYCEAKFLLSATDSLPESEVQDYDKVEGVYRVSPCSTPARMSNSSLLPSGVTTLALEPAFMDSIARSQLGGTL